MDRPPASWLKRHLENPFALDLRSLALYRVLLAVLLLSDLGVRAGDLTVHYTDAGVVPRSMLPNPWKGSVHLYGGSAAFQGAMFAVSAAVAVALLVGYRTPFAAFLSWYLLTSLQGRNHTVLHGGDMLMRLLLFWGIFLPLGARFSLDRRAGRSALPGPRVFTAATAALVIQLFCEYFFAAMQKVVHPIWHGEYSAVYYALSLDQFSTPVGKEFLNHPGVMRFLTASALWLEMVGPWLLFVPVFVGPLRLLVIAAFTAFHLGLAVTMELGNFPWICIIGWMALTPSLVWDRLARWTGFGAEPPPVEGETPLRTARDRIAWLERALVVFLIGYVVLWNIRTVAPEFGGKLLPQSWNWFGDSFQLGQNWSMFAPYPATDDGWFVVRGTLKDGREVDLFRGGASMTWEKPPLVSETYINARWRRYLMNLQREQWARFRPGYANYLWREWDATHDGPHQLQKLEVIFVLELTRPNYEPSEPRRLTLYKLPPDPPPTDPTKKPV